MPDKPYVSVQFYDESRKFMQSVVMDKTQASVTKVPVPSGAAFVLVQDHA
jgi:hypothetical protein